MFDLINTSQQVNDNHRFLFDTGVSKNCFRNTNIDYSGIFSQAYIKKFSYQPFPYLSTAMSFLELIGIARDINENNSNIPIEEIKNLSMDVLEKNIKKMEKNLKKQLPINFIKEKYEEEINYPKNVRSTRVILKNAGDTYLPNLKSFYFMTATNLLLRSNTFYKEVACRNRKQPELEQFYKNFLQKYPNLSLAYLFFNITSIRSSEHKDIKKLIAIEHIQSAYLKELLDFEAVHFLTRGFWEEDRGFIPVIFVTTEKNQKRWRERIYLYKGILNHLKIPTMNKSLLYFLTKKTWLKISSL